MNFLYTYHLVQFSGRKVSKNVHSPLWGLLFQNSSSTSEWYRGIFIFLNFWFQWRFEEYSPLCIGYRPKLQGLQFIFSLKNTMISAQQFVQISQNEYMGRFLQQKNPGNISNAIFNAAWPLYVWHEQLNAFGGSV